VALRLASGARRASGR